MSERHAIPSFAADIRAKPHSLRDSGSASDIERAQLAGLRIARAEAAVVRQRQIAAKLKDQGCLSEIAQSLLVTMEAVFETMRRHRDLAECIPHQIFMRNRLLTALPASDFVRLAPDLEPIPLTAAEVLVKPGQEIRDVVFIESGIASVLAQNRDRRIEVGAVGRDGFIGAPVVLDAAQSPLEYVMWSPGDGMRIRAGHLRRAMSQSSALRDMLYRYTHAFQMQMAEAAASHGLASVEERVARWLLMRHDRSEGDTIEVTHEMLASVLGVRRASVTDAIHRLEGAFAIRATRGTILVRDRRLLEKLSHKTYGSADAEYHRLFPDTQGSLA